jgi:hypothetical protein
MAFETADFKMAEPKGWHAVAKYGGAEVGFLRSQNTKEMQVILVATSPQAVQLDKNYSFLKSEMKKMEATNADFKVLRYSELKGSPKNAYVKYSFKNAGVVKNEIMVAVPNKTKTHFILLSSDGDSFEGAENELVALVHNFQLK